MRAVERSTRACSPRALCQHALYAVRSARTLLTAVRRSDPIAVPRWIIYGAVLSKFYEKFIEGKKSEYIDDDGNVIKVPGAQYDEMGVRKLYTGQEENELADEAAKNIAGV